MQPLDVKNNEEVHLIRGDLEAIKVYSLSRISITNPEIADIANVDSNQVLLVGKRVGQTMLFIWDEYGKRTVVIRVFEENPEQVMKRLQQMLEKMDISEVKLEINSLEGKVVASGQILPEKADDYKKALEPFTSSVINLVKTQASEDLVQVDVQIAELSTTLSKTIGIEWPSSLDYTEDPGTFVANTQRDIFKVGPLSRTTQIIATVNALILQGKGRILSKPKLVVINGKQASFQVGGEIPIATTTTSSGGNVQQNVTFKDYGITMTVTPTIKNGNKVEINVNVDIRDIDAANAVGENVAFTTRNAQTQLVLDNSQTVVLAGLIKHTETDSVTKVPFLGDIPIVGFVFRNHAPLTNAETEMVISLTPTIIRQRDSDAEKKKSESAAQTTQASEKQLMDLPAMSVDESKEVSASAEEGASGLEESDRVLSVSDKAHLNPPGSPSGVSGVTEDMAPYVQAIQKKISESIAYPYEAKEKGWEGTVKLALHILKDGTLADATVKESSGHDVFDNDALNTAQILAPYEAFPPGLSLEELIVTIPIVYSQKPVVPDGVCEPGINPKDLSSNAFLPGGVAYSEMVQKRIAESIVYPEEARVNGWEGTVKLALHILRNGTLAYAGVKESSGYELFDECALKTAKTLAPYSEFPSESDLQEVNITIPIVYSLKSN